MSRTDMPALVLHLADGPDRCLAPDFHLGLERGSLVMSKRSPGGLSELDASVLMARQWGLLPSERRGVFGHLLRSYKRVSFAGLF